MSGRILRPGRYGLADLRIGDIIETGKRHVTTQEIDAFAKLTGDQFEIHMNTLAAQRYGFANRVAHGLLVQSLIDGLKNQAPVQFSAIASLGWNWRFSAPVLADDTISATIRVIALRGTSDGERGIATLDFDVRNQSGETVQSGTNNLMIFV